MKKIFIFMILTGFVFLHAGAQENKNAIPDSPENKADDAGWAFEGIELSSGLQAIYGGQRNLQDMFYEVRTPESEDRMLNEFTSGSQYIYDEGPRVFMIQMEGIWKYRFGGKKAIKEIALHAGFCAALFYGYIEAVGADYLPFSVVNWVSRYTYDELRQGLKAGIRLPLFDNPKFGMYIGASAAYLFHVSGNNYIAEKEILNNYGNANVDPFRRPYSRLKQSTHTTVLMFPVGLSWKLHPRLQLYTELLTSHSYAKMSEARLKTQQHCGTTVGCRLKLNSR